VRRRLGALRAELETDLESLGDLLPVRERASEVEELVVDLDRQIERVSEAAVITLVGATGAGKSTLLNALVGRAVAVEGQERPTTSSAVVYRPRDADLRELLAGLPGEAPTVVDYDPEGGGPWRGQILVDAPDVNSVATEHREVVAALAARSDVLVVVAHRQSIAELASVVFVDAFAGRRGMLFVLNRADELTAAAGAELLEQLRTLASERWGAPDAPVLSVSARTAKQDDGDPSWMALTSTLRDLVAGGRLGRVRRLNALGTAARIGEHFRELAQGGLTAGFDSLEQALERGLAGWRRRLETALDERLALRRADLAAMLWSETARHWGGPGGRALRAGGLSALGLGAGAMLARRNPVLAAGAAAGAIAADKLGAGIRERGLRDAAGLLPGPIELEASWRAELGEARLAANALGGRAEFLGVPAAEELGLRATAAADEAWSRLLERDLPAVAQGAASLPLRLTIDLPVYLLGAWVVARVAIGFFSGNYASFDFLLSAALLLFAWLFVARSAVRALLTGRARGLLDAVRAFTASALEGSTEGLAREVGERVQRRRDALGRLMRLEERWSGRLIGVPGGEGTPQEPPDGLATGSVG